MLQSGVRLERFRGAPHTVEHIREAAYAAQQHYDIRLLAEEIVGFLGSKDAVSEILACYRWLHTNCRYANDPRHVELVRSPREILSRIVAAAKRARHGWRPSLDCDDLIALLAALLLVLGREVRLVTGAYRNAFHNGERQYQHVWLQVREPRTGVLIVLDPVAAEATRQSLSRLKAVKIWPI